MRAASPVQGVISGMTCPLKDCTGVGLQPQKSQAGDDKPNVFGHSADATQQTTTVTLTLS